MSSVSIITRGSDLPRGTVYVAAAFKSIEPLPLEVFELRGIGESQQMTDAENGLTEAKTLSVWRSTPPR